MAEPIHNALLDTYREKIKTYRMEKTKWDTLGKEKANTPEPEQPQLKMLLIAGDNTGTGIQENLMDSGGVGLICETEADTVSTAIGGDHGHWSDLLRKCFDHDRLAYNRRTNHEYRECNVTFLCVLLSGTPAQIKPLIPSAENGLFSRQLFYYMPAIEEWEDQFNEADTDYDSRFLKWGAQWKEVLDAITASVSNINMKLTHEQKEIFNFHFARVFGRASAIHGNQMKSAVTRIAINIFRIISIIALLRSLESLLPGGERSGEPQENIVRTLLNCPGLTPSAHIPQENIADGIVPQFNLSIRTDDFYAVLALVEPLYRHACHIGAPVHLLDGGGQLDQVVGYLLFLQILVRVLDGVVDNGEDLLRDLLACHSVTGFQLPPSFLADPPAERLAGDPRHLDDPFLRDSLEVQSLGGIFRLMSGSCHNELFFLQRCTAERPEGKKMRGRCTQC